MPGCTVQRSDDGGHSFTNLGLPASWVWDVAVSPTDPDVIYANASGGVMYWSHNGGATWTLLAPELTDSLAVQRPKAFPGLLAVAGLGRHEALASHDAGDTGFVLGRAFESTVLSFASTTTALFAATEGDGVFALR